LIFIDKIDPPQAMHQIWTIKQRPLILGAPPLKKMAKNTPDHGFIGLFCWHGSCDIDPAQYPSISTKEYP
jgi:hypothetical protein